jgi:hypothetical protein
MDKKARAHQDDRLPAYDADEDSRISSPTKAFIFTFAISFLLSPLLGLATIGCFGTRKTHPYMLLANASVLSLYSGILLTAYLQLKGSLSENIFQFTLTVTLCAFTAGLFLAGFIMLKKTRRVRSFA